MSGRTSDEIIFAARESINNKGRYNSQDVQDMMDLVSGVINYRMDSRKDQGWIYRKLLHDRIESNHIIDVDSMISRFWYGVMKALSKVKTAGTVMQIKQESNQDGVCVRETLMSSLNFLRNSGLSAARRYIDSTYKRRLKQQCGDCHQIGPLTNIREYDNGCQHCGSYDSILKQGWMRHRMRECMSCGKTRPTKFERVCGQPSVTAGGIVFVGGCGSQNVALVTTDDVSHSEAEYEEVNDLSDDGTVDPETQVIFNDLEADVNRFVHDCELSMPRDPNDPTGDSKNRKILRILVQPTEGTDICKRCAHNAHMQCVQQCGEQECDHIKAPDPKECCGSSSFAIGACVNYSKKIGEYMGFTTTLANHRVKKIRKFTLKFAKDNKGRYETAAYITSRLSEE